MKAKNKSEWSIVDTETQGNDCIFLIVLIILRIVSFNIIKTYQSIHVCISHFFSLIILCYSLVKISKTVVATLFV